MVSCSLVSPFQVFNFVNFTPNLFILVATKLSGCKALTAQRSGDSHLGFEFRTVSDLDAMWQRVGLVVFGVLSNFAPELHYKTTTQQQEGTRE